MMNADDVSPRARNYYNEEDYFSLNVRNGVIRSPIGTRMLAVPEELVQGIHLALEEEAGSAAGIVLYQCGRWWGKQFAKRHSTETRHFYGMDAGDLPLAFQLQVMRRVWALYGWGSLDLSFEHRERGFLSATVENAMYSDVVGNVGRTSDFIMAGVLASLTGELAGRDLECVEIACRSRGDQRCAFLMGIKTRLDVVSAWVKQGRTRAEIEEAIGRGELV